MAAKPKRVQGRKGRQQPAKQARRPARRQAAEQKPAGEPREPNGHEGLQGPERMEEPFTAASQFARIAGEQVKQAAGQTGWSGVTPQVLGWAAAAPAQQLETMMSQLWGLGGNGGSSRYMRALAQSNVEMIGLLGRRGRAYLDLPAHLARCRTPQQVLDEQAKFVQEMLHDYQVTNDRVMSCWLDAAAPSQQ